MNNGANTLTTTGQLTAGTVNNFKGSGNDTIKLGGNVTAPTIVFGENVVLATDVNITGNAVFNGKVDALAAGVQGLTVTGDPPLKPTSQYTVIGKPYTNYVTESKVRAKETWIPRSASSVNDTCPTHRATCSGTWLARRLCP